MICDQSGIFHIDPRGVVSRGVHDLAEPHRAFHHLSFALDRHPKDDILLH